MTGVGVAKVCTIEGCQGKHNAHGYCDKHYRSWKRHGDPLSGIRKRRSCTYEGCDSPAHGRGYCEMHYNRWWKHGDPSIVLPNPGGGRVSTGRITYDGAHRRVYRAKGKASDHMCPCGKQANEWAYDHADPHEWTTERAFKGRVVTVAYSGDPDHYGPLCYRCHLDDSMEGAGHGPSR